MAKAPHRAPAAGARVLGLALGTRLTLRAGATLVVDGDSRIVVDPGPFQSLAELAAALHPHGLTPADIDTVYFTHLHFDHYTPAAIPPGVRRVCIPAAERAFIDALTPLAADLDAYRARLLETHERIAPVFLREFVRLARDARYDFARLPYADRLVELGPDARPSAHTRTVALPGHCPGQLGLEVTTAHGTVLIAGDAVLSLADWQAPDVSHHLIVHERAALIASRERAGQADCVVPGHGDWFSPRSGRVLATDSDLIASTGVATA